MELCLGPEGAGSYNWGVSRAVRRAVMALGLWTGDARSIRRSWVAVLLKEASRV